MVRKLFSLGLALALTLSVSAAAFAGAELLALCAVDEGRLQSRLFRISIHGVVSALGCWEGLPGALLIHPDGMIVCGVLGKLLLLRPDGRVARCLPCGLPACLRPCPGGLLCADALDGCVTRVTAALTDAQCVYRGDSPLDAMVL